MCARPLIRGVRAFPRATASAFERAKEKGLHSQNFDVDKNIEEKDTRNMADEEILEEIMVSGGEFDGRLGLRAQL